MANAPASAQIPRIYDLRESLKHKGYVGGEGLKGPKGRKDVAAEAMATDRHLATGFGVVIPEHETCDRAMSLVSPVGLARKISWRSMLPMIRI